MASGFKSPRIPAKSSKTLSIAKATALTEQMGLVFSEIEDPRVARTRAHLLIDIVIIGILSVIAGGQGWEDMENYGLSKYDWSYAIFSFAKWYSLPRYISTSV